MKGWSRRIAGAALVALAGTMLSGTAVARSRSGGVKGLMELLTGDHHLFVGTVDSVTLVPHVPSGPCSHGGVGGRQIVELAIRSEEVLFGAGIRHRQVIHQDLLGSPQVSRGDRVLVWGNRSCANGWNLWTWLMKIDGTGLIASRGRVSNGNRVTVAPGSDYHSDYVVPWAQAHGREPTLQDVRDSVKAMSARLLDRPFLSPDGFVLVVVEESVVVPPDTLVLRCRLLEHIAGREGEAPGTLRFVPRRHQRFAKAEVGDSLLVPFDEIHRGPVRTYSTGPDYFVVDHGFLPGLGVDFSRLMERYEARDGGFNLRAMIQESAK